ncbi:maleylpyruvate isomerase family mycothiol-dependent enzyme [Streptomyces sp. NPDC101150]|uniref:maleylpyruvate isomerase family mycothiol-dependent enzyme n=1 Tax=Streptomyces sp. NPDC101150 TaxID=3366114 RepID=UPI00381A0E60
MTLQGSLTHERYCDQLLAEAERFRSHLRDADLSATVPTCPDWTLADLVRHVGGAHRWAGTIVATRSTEFVSLKSHVRQGPEGTDREALDAWFAEGAERTVAALREAGPDAEVWTWAPVQRSGFWARRMTHETLMHRADAAATTGAAFEVPQDVAADCLEEWLQLCALPVLAERRADRAAEVFGPGRSIHFHATDTPPELNAEWFVDLTGDPLTHRRTHEKATVALRGPLTDVLRVAYRRLPADSDRVAVLGDRGLLDRWLNWATL